ncbi:hypothetical protein QZH41_006977 [Actinostola sp. cb2023]|nr:hypothetical protein QZH41_006977 [Actinostola sp. cb2023]
MEERKERKKGKKKGRKKGSPGRMEERKEGRMEERKEGRKKERKKGSPGRKEVQEEGKEERKKERKEGRMEERKGKRNEDRKKGKKGNKKKEGREEGKKQRKKKDIKGGSWKKGINTMAQRKAWPIMGGVSGEQPEKAPSELIITGNTAVRKQLETEVLNVRILLVAGATYVLLYQFSMTEQCVELVQIELHLSFEPTPGTPVSSEQDNTFAQPGDRSSNSSGDFMPEPVPLPIVFCKTGTYKRHAGFQAELACVMAGSLEVLAESPGNAHPQTPHSVTPLTPATPITPGTPLSFTLSMDPSGGLDFSETTIQKLEKRRSKPARPPPPIRTKSKVDEASNGNDVTEGAMHTKVHRTVSYPSTASVGPPDTVQCTKFACSYTKKNDNWISPCLLVGTTKGNVFMVVINMPPAEERLVQPILTIITETVTARESSERHFLAVCTEREAKVYQLPTAHTNPTSYSKTSVADDTSVVLSSQVVVIEV